MGQTRALLTLLLAETFLLMLYMSGLKTPVTMVDWKTRETQDSDNKSSCSCQCKCPLKEVTLQDDNSGRKDNITSADAGLKTLSRKEQRKLKKKQKRLMREERAEKRKYLADQESVLHVPTEAPGWIYNKTAADLFRKEIHSCQDDRFDNGNFLVTKKNSPLKTVLHCYDGRANITVSGDILDRLPEDSPFKNKHYNTCSVVGNGGVLKGSGCGEQIDEAEFVFRCNMAPLHADYLNDVGTKTSLITINPSIIKTRYQRLRKTIKRNKFVQDMSAYGGSYVWITAFDTKACATQAFKAHQALKESQERPEVVFPHPEFRRSLQDFWKNRGVHAKRASTGLFLVGVAMQLCEEVHLYGFWPYHSDRNHTRLTQHYYDNMFATKAHSLSEEFGLLQSLHNAGVLRLTTGHCQ